ncbi:MAG: DNA polymerase III subunit beta, partial [Chitinivibrionales bacterium]|nr:DNA polymerase III subunit beta [Chitinivibrionales bacterium]
IATDLDHSIKVKTDLNGTHRFEVTINAKKFFDIIRELYDDDVTIDVRENILIIESGGTFSCKIAGVDSRDFPEFPLIESSCTVVLNCNQFKDMVSKSCFAVSVDDSRACLRGVLWEFDSTRTGMIATDGHRLGSSFYTGSFVSGEKVQNIISPKSLLHLIKIVDDSASDATIRVSFNDKYILFSTDTVTLCSKLIEGPYPDYEKVIPRLNTKKAVLHKSTLLEAVRRVSVLSNQKTHLVKFTFKNSSLEIVVFNRDIGAEARQNIPISYDGDEHVIGLNAAYFVEILSIIKTSSIRLEMNTQISACLVFPHFEKDEEKESDDLFLIMPLRILDEA